jgi:hypothetical protein
MFGKNLYIWKLGQDDGRHKWGLDLPLSVIRNLVLLLHKR